MPLVAIRGLATIPVWSNDSGTPTAAAVLGISRDLAYRSARSGDIPTIRVGRRVVVPVPAFLRWLGVDDIDGRGGSAESSRGHVGASWSRAL